MGAETTGSRRGASLAHPLCGSNLATLVTVLARNGGVRPARLPQAAIALGAVLGRLPFTALERAWVAWLRRVRPPMPAPVFILGHWRSGTTHLYNLLSRDPAFGIITPFATGLPWDLLGLSAVLRPLLERALPEHRFIDNIPVTPDSPQEDEIALANMSPLSFYHGLYFPSRFQENFDRGIFFDHCSPAEIAAWRRRFVYFLEKVSLDQGGRRLLIKNPVHTARVALLREIWPEAKFIHIHRDPRLVFVSMLNFYEKLFAQFALQRSDQVDAAAVVLETYPRMMTALLDQTAGLPADVFVELAFEGFERDPLGEAERIYRTLDLPGFAAARPRFAAYLDSVRRYEKNRYRLPADTLERVERAWAPFIARWGRAEAPAIAGA